MMAPQPTHAIATFDAAGAHFPARAALRLAGHMSEPAFGYRHTTPDCQDSMTSPLFRPSAVVFDMDGIIFNTEDLYDVVGAELLKRRQCEFTRDLKLKMMGRPAPAAFEMMRQECGLDDSIETLQAESDEIFKTLLPERIELMPGFQAVLEAVQKRGLPTAVATSSHRDFATTALGIFDLLDRFQFVLTGDDVRHGKPDPEIYLKAAEKLGLSPQQILVFEDSHAGSLAATRAGAWTVAVPTPYARHLDFSHANLVVPRLDDPRVMKILQSSAPSH